VPTPSAHSLCPFRRASDSSATYQTTLAGRADGSGTSAGIISAICSLPSMENLRKLNAKEHVLVEQDKATRSRPQHSAAISYPQGREGGSFKARSKWRPPPVTTTVDLPTAVQRPIPPVANILVHPPIRCRAPLQLCKFNVPPATPFFFYRSRQTFPVEL